MRQLITSGVLLLFLSCTSKGEKKDNERVIIRTSAPLLSKSELAFDSCMGRLAQKYSLGQMFIPSDSNQFHTLFVLKKSVYFPGRNLTIDYFNLPDASHSHAPVFYLHNDTFKFVLPMVEWYYQRAKDKYVGDTIKNNQKSIIFAPEFFRLADALNLSGKEELGRLMDDLVSFFEIPKVSTGLQFTAFKAKAEYLLKILQLEKGDLRCIEQINEGISIVQKNYLNTDRVIYSDGAIIIVLSGLDTKLGTLEIQNTNCTYWAR